MAANEYGDVLLVQAWPNTDTWSLPGGGIKRSERGHVAAARELREEVGISVAPDTVKSRGTFQMRGHKEIFYNVTVPKSELPPVPPNRWEIKEAAWFPFDNLPNVSPAVRRILAEVADER